MIGTTTLMAVAISVATPVAAAGPALILKSSFEGQEIEFASRLDEQGRLALDGRFVGGRQQFHLLVDEDGHAEGAIGRTPIAFDISVEQRRQLVRQVEAISAAA